MHRCHKLQLTIDLSLCKNSSLMLSPCYTSTNAGYGGLLFAVGLGIMP